MDRSTNITYPAEVYQAVLRERDELRAENEQLRAALKQIYVASRRAEVSWRLGALAREALGSPPTSTDWWRECQSLRAELERVRSNHVTVAEEIQRRHDACAPLTAEIERLNGVHHADQYTLTLQARENERLRAALARLCDESEHVIHQGARVCACGQAVLA